MSQLADIEFALESDPVVARLTGEIDQSNAETLGTTLTEGVPNQALVLILDLSGVDYLDSSGIQLIYELRTQLKSRGQELRLVIPATAASHTALRLAGVTGQIPIFETLDEAGAKREA